MLAGGSCALRYIEWVALTSFGGLLQVTEDTHAGETENSGLNHLGGCSEYSCGIMDYVCGWLMVSDCQVERVNERGVWVR